MPQQSRVVQSEGHRYRAIDADAAVNSDWDSGRGDFYRAQGSNLDLPARHHQRRRERSDG